VAYFLRDVFDRPGASQGAYLSRLFDQDDQRGARLDYGLASEVVPDAELDATVREYLSDDPEGAAHRDRGVKDYMRSAPDMAIAGCGRLRRNLHATINASIEARMKK